MVNKGIHVSIQVSHPEGLLTNLLYVNTFSILVSLSGAHAFESRPWTSSAPTEVYRGLP